MRTHNGDGAPLVDAERNDRESASRTAIVSLPLPDGFAGSPVLGNLPTQMQMLAEHRPHCLLAAVSNAELPDALSIATGASPDVSGLPGIPEVRRVVIDEKKHGIVMNETGEVRIVGADGALAVRLGLDTDEGLHWWEWVNIEPLWSGPVASAWRAGGYAAVHHDQDAELRIAAGRYTSTWLHQHNWIYCELHLLLFATGVVRIHARHINNRFFDRGAEVNHAVPVIGFGTADGEPITGAHEWSPVDDAELAVGSTRIDLTDAATLANADYPARVCVRDTLQVYQPYAGAELYGHAGEDENNHTVIDRINTAESRRIPRGVARTVRLTAGLGGVAPLISRYRLPNWYHAQCGNLWPGCELPARGPAGNLPDLGAQALREHMRRDCFEDGAVARSCGNRRRQEDPERPRRINAVAESGWEGDTPNALLLYYHLSGDPAVLDDALRDAYYMADVGTDHSEMAVLMHGKKLDARSLPMQRVLGCIAAYLETADPYLLETAQGVMDNAYWWDRTNWPRRSVGRDASYVRGLVRLSDVTDHEHYLNRAREALLRFTRIQREDGSFADQGGTVGFHANVNEVVKPWMNSIISEAMLDYLDRRHDPTLEKSFLGVARWFASAAVEVTDDHGDSHVAWGYKYRHGDNPTMPTPEKTPFPVGVGGVRADLYRQLLSATLRTGDPSYVDLALRNATLNRIGMGIDQTANKRIEMGAWFDANVCRASAGPDGLLLKPAPLPEGREVDVTVHTPLGDVALRMARTADTLTMALEEPQPFAVRVVRGSMSVTLAPGEREAAIPPAPPSS